jgi:hypothetical protein
MAAAPCAAITLPHVLMRLPAQHVAGDRRTPAPRPLTSFRIPALASGGRHVQACGTVAVHVARGICRERQQCGSTTIELARDGSNQLLGVIVRCP